MDPKLVPARFLILDSASPALLWQSSETLNEEVSDIFATYFGCRRSVKMTKLGCVKSRRKLMRVSNHSSNTRRLLFSATPGKEF
ncbi:MAG: hypothetical protein ACYDDO_08055 [Acidiferrobacterales bacterium]